MFAPYCPIHGSHVLLFADNIDSIDNSGEGVTVHFHCTCGFNGVWDPRESRSINLNASGRSQQAVAAR